MGFAVPEKMLAWRLYGEGMENFGDGDQPCELPVPEIRDDELLVRIDAIGLCFSDVKLIRAGEAHPRVISKDLRHDPVIPGHEAVMTVVRVGSKLTGKFQVGQRYIIQADIYVNGKGFAYGYAIDGGMSQYSVLDQRVLNGDEGCYLLPISDSMPSAVAALLEPWTCVQASYMIENRRAPLPGGRTRRHPEHLVLELRIQIFAHSRGQGQGGGVHAVEIGQEVRNHRRVVGGNAALHVALGSRPLKPPGGAVPAGDQQLLPVHHALPHLLPHAPHHAALRVHAHRGTRAAHRVDAVALVVAQNHVVVVAAQTDAPRSVQRGLQDHALATIRAAVEDDHLVVLAAAQQIGKTRVELHRGEVVFVPRERLNARLGLVVPDFDRLEGERKREGNAVVAAGGQVGFVVAGVEVQAVYAF